MFQRQYANVFEGDERWRSLQVPTRRSVRNGIDALDLRPQAAVCRATSAKEPAPLADIRGARVLALLGDSITTDHISPAGSIPADSPAGRYLIAQGVQAGRLQFVWCAPRQSRSHDARHIRQHPSAQSACAGHRRRLDDAIKPGVGELMTIYDASIEVPGRWRAAARPCGQGVRFGLVARLGGKGHAAAGRARGDCRELRADSPQQSGEHGRAAAAVQDRGVGRRRWA